MKKAYIWWLLGLFSLISCLSPSQKTQRLIARSELDPVAFPVIGGAWLGLHPCANDTILIHVDSVTKTDTFFSQQIVPFFHGDTVFYHDTLRFVKKILKNVFQDRLIVDKAAINAARDSANEAQKQAIFWQGQTKINQDRADRLNDKIHWIYWIGGLSMLIIILIWAIFKFFTSKITL